MDVIVFMEKELMDVMESNDMINPLVYQKLRFSELRDDIGFDNGIYFIEDGFVTHKRKIMGINRVINQIVIGPKEEIDNPVPFSDVAIRNFFIFLKWSDDPDIGKGIMPIKLSSPYRMVFPVPYGLNPNPKYSAPSCPFCKSHSTNGVTVGPYRGTMWCAKCGGMY